MNRAERRRRARERPDLPVLKASRKLHNWKQRLVRRFALILGAKHDVHRMFATPPACLICAIATVKGRRLPWPDVGNPIFKSGDYAKDPHGFWWVLPPAGHLGTLHEDHVVTEHSTGTITVRPSIQSDAWHGFLENGVWREL